MQTCTHCSLPIPSGRVQFCCFGCRIAHELVAPALQEDGSSRAVSLWTVRLGLGVFLAINIMVFNWTFYSGEYFGPAARSGEGFEAVAGLFAYLQLFLCTIVVATLGLPLLADSSRGGHLRLDANLLISVAVFSAYGLSAWHTLRGRGSLYFDTAAMVLVLLTLGNYLEARSKRRAVESSSPLDNLPQRAWVEVGGLAQEVDAESLQPGDLVRLRAGELASVDGIVRRGSSHIDASRLTGESRRKPVGAGDEILAGSANLEGDLWVEARRTGDQRTIACMQQLLQEARSKAPSMQRTTDRLAAFFTPAVILLALGVFGWHALDGAWEEGLLTGLSMLLISCPCALGLAAPLSCWSGLGWAGRHGILFDSAPALERASRVRQVFFDKTGTLTEPGMQAVRLSLTPEFSRHEALYLAASVESASLHPIAGCLVETAAKAEISPGIPADFAILAGLGIEARIDGKLYRLGGRRLLDVLGYPTAGIAASRDGEEGETVVFLADEARVLARFDVAERPRTEAQQAIRELAEDGLSAAILTGDESGPARRLADQLGLSVEHSLLPQDKVQCLLSARQSGRGAVAMVGDGINDAPVLAAADVGIAVAAASGLASQSGNVRLLTPSLLGVPDALAIARHTVRRIRLGLIWALGYNSIGITLAAWGLLTPVFAASSMILSSLLIIALSRRAGKVEAGGWGLGAGGQGLVQETEGSLAQDWQGEGRTGSWTSEPPASSPQPPA